MPLLPRTVLFTLASALALASAVQLSAQTSPPSQAPPVKLTNAEDHQRMMDQLHITALRPGADGYKTDSPNYAIYDESKVDRSYKLPDVLTTFGGKKVTAAKMWWNVRRPELVEYFDREINGRVPKGVPKVTWEIVSTAPETIGDIPVITKKLIGHVDNSAYPAITVNIDLTLSTPANAGGPVPVIMEFGSVFATRPGAAPPAAPTHPDWQKQVLAKGWGFAELIPTSYQADNGAGLDEGIIGLVNHGQPRKPEDWGAFRAWAWGASRTLDYFQTDPAVDAKQVGLEGHSRFADAVLVAMATDPRFAIVFVSSSGMGGAKPWRSPFGGRISNVTSDQEYHWVAGNLLKYGGPLTANDLLVDSNELLALCAPRPVFVSDGAATKPPGDGWVDARGSFDAVVAASPAWVLLGRKGVSATTFPAIETPVIDGDIAYREHAGNHTPVPNWPTFLTFASRYLYAPPAK
jgi:hypothetical protein